MAPSDLIYSHTSLVAPSSAQPCNHSAPNVSKEQRDIKRNYDGFRRIKWTQGLGLLQISALAWQFHTHSRCPASKKNTKKKNKSRREISSRCLCFVWRGSTGNKVHRIAGKNTKNPRRQTLYYGRQWQQLCPHGQGTKSAAVCRFVAAVRQFIPHRHGRRDSEQLSGIQLWTLVFDWNSLLKVPPLHSLPRSSSA